MRVNFAIVFVSDMKRAVAFYRDVIELPLRFESPGWTEFATDGATLALHLTEGPETAPGGCRMFGARLAQYADPDGLAISVGEAKK
jgi:catechol 2,3-dioxygenase-like lactoylglutathione lyase family enzyme